MADAQPLTEAQKARKARIAELQQEIAQHKVDIGRKQGLVEVLEEQCEALVAKQTKEKEEGVK